MDQPAPAAQDPDLPPRTGVTLQRPAIVALLFLMNIFVGFSVFVGLVLAYIWRSDAETQAWEKTHYTYLIRTFWIGLALFIGMFLVWMAIIFGSVAGVGERDAPNPGFFVGFFGVVIVWLLGAVWFCIRSILSLVRASNCKPMDEPRTWLF